MRKLLLWSPALVLCSCRLKILQFYKEGLCYDWFYDKFKEDFQNNFFYKNHLGQLLQHKTINYIVSTFIIKCACTDVE